MQNAVALAALVVIVSVFMPRTVAQDKATPPAYRTSAALDVLRSDSSLEAKYEACRQLARRGDERAVPLLGELLADEQLSHMARYALEPMPFSSVDDVFREALTRLKGDLLIGVIHSIGVRGDGPAAGKVGELIQDPNPGVANAAAKALGQIAAAECVPVLQRVLATATGDRRTSVADACLRCAGGRLRRGDSQGATRLFDALRAANVPKHHVLAGIRGSILARGMDGLPLLFELLESDDRAMRGLGMRVAGELPGAELCEALADTMSTLRPEAQLLLVQVFQDRADAAAHGAIKRAARSNSPVVRVAALRALGELGDASCVSLLIDAAGAAERPDESAAAWMSLCRIPVPGVAAAVVAAMSSAEPGLRVKLIEVLEARKASAAVEHLLEEARSANAGVSTAAFSALAVLARPVDVPALASLLVRCPHVSAREEALRAVSSAAARIDDVSRRGDAVLALLATTQDGAARCQLLQALGRIGNFQAFDTLRSALNGTDTRERDIALRSLANWHDATPASLLVRLAADTEDRVHRTLALRGVIRMAGLVAADCEQPSTQVLQWFSEANRVAIGPDEKKLVLSGLARLGHPSALAMASGCLDDPDVQSEAGLALVGIASTLGDLGHRDAAETALDKVMATVKDPTVRKQVEKALRGLQVSTEYIHAWQICGPYTQKGKQCQQLYGVAFPPEKTDGKADWRQLNRSIGGGGKMTEVGPTFPGNHRAAYVRTWLMSAGEQRARLELGFDDGGKVWLNGEVVCEANTAGACVPGAHQADVALREGRNLLFLKLTQHTGPWRFSVRLVGPDGKPLPDVDVSAGAAPPVAPAVSASMPVANEADFSKVPAVPLFDGKTLEGWEGASGCFHVVDGAIVGGQMESPIAVSDYLCTTREYGDFELTAQVRTLGARTNGGIQFRGARVPNSHAMRGYQADVCDGAYWGCLYDCARGGFAARVPQKELTHVLRIGDWNEYRIRAVGRRIQLWLNGYRTIDWTETNAEFRTTGVFGLQTHKGPPGEGCYRRMLIKEVK